MQEVESVITCRQLSRTY